MCTKGNCGTSRPYGTTTTMGGGGSAPAIPGDLIASGSMLSDLINFGDLGTALTSAGIEKALGSTPTAYKSGLAVAVSVVSRMITRNFGGIVSLNGTITSPVTKDIFIVGLVNALVNSMAPTLILLLRYVIQLVSNLDRSPPLKMRLLLLPSSTLITNQDALPSLPVWAQARFAKRSLP